MNRHVIHQQLTNILTKEVLYKEYILNKLSAYKIAKQYNCSKTVILKYLKKFGIPSRNKSESQKGIPRWIIKTHPLLGKKGRIPWNKGKTDIYSEETLQKISLANKKRFTDPKNHPMWKGGISPCLECNNKKKSRYAIYCRLCYKGSNVANWQGGISFYPYPTVFNEQLKSKIRCRDNYKCQYCLIPQNECNRALDIHHIDYNKQNCSEDNLISLCKKCHNIVHFDRDYWYAYYRYIIDNGIMSTKK